MASHVPFLAVRPEEQASPEIKLRDTTKPRRSSKATKAQTVVKKAEEEVKKTARKARNFLDHLRFPLVLILSLSLRLAAYTLVAEWAGLELASVSRDLRKDWQVGAVLTWKVLELIGVWWAEYDWIDLASLSLLSNLPFYFLLSSFYQLSGLSIGTSLTIDIVSLTLPFILLRSHVRSTRDEDLLRPLGRAVAHDYQILALTSVLAAVVFGATLYISFASWLPVHMIEHFDNLRTLDIAHDSNIYKLAGLFVPAGLAAMHFLFLPTVSASNSLLSALDSVTKDAPFDPESATLLQTIAYNFGLKEEMSAKTEVLFKRTAVLALGSAINTFVRVFATIDGAEASGALGWAALWAGAISFVGVVFRWVAE
ncbi:hypothetical protein AMS68_001322 [Peltaster fructicola]|uniref:Uncharacterized protein n=1 Tax=Peltaster fructicola TaxID=286661 RepID=A0A6H0XME9_9PEZI|nr:hypothetical protein AMS68_001322 [Peltaster fructicola]